MGIFKLKEVVLSCRKMDSDSIFLSLVGSLLTQTCHAPHDTSQVVLDFFFFSNFSFSLTDSLQLPRFEPDLFAQSFPPAISCPWVIYSPFPVCIPKKGN